MTVSVDTPDIQVTIIKRVARSRVGESTRFLGRQRRIELRDFLGDGCGVSVSKNLDRPDGSFTVTLVDQGDFRQSDSGRGVLDSVYGVAEPMDYIEIRMARRPFEYKTQMPIVMRGFVSRVRRSKFMQGDKPVRKVEIIGQDFGKIPLMVRIFLRADYGQGFDESTTNFLSSFRLFARTGKFGYLESPKQFMTDCVSLLNTYLGKMADFTGTRDAVPTLTLESSVTDGQISPFAMQMFGGDEGGSVWELMSSWADVPWNELFIEDRDTGPFVVYRPCPIFGLDDKPLKPLGAAALPTDVTVESADIQVFDIVRSDDDVANYFWVQAPISTLQTISYLNIESVANGQVFVPNNPNCDPLLYGLRRVAAQSNQMDPRWQLGDDSADANKQVEYSQRQKDWITRRRDQLIAMNQDNVIFENGVMVIKGNERIRVGTYITVQEGGLKWLAYVRQVTHRFQAFGNFTTSIVFSRGTNFLRRVQLNPSPYYLEGQPGVYE